MAVLDEKMKEIFKQQGIFVFGTAGKDGVPNVVPIGAIKILDDETILVSDQFFNKTLKNLKENPKIAISFWKGREGYQIKGDAEVLTEGALYQETNEWMQERTKGRLSSKGAIRIAITDHLFCLARTGSREKAGLKIRPGAFTAGPAAFSSQRIKGFNIPPGFHGRAWRTVHRSGPR